MSQCSCTNITCSWCVYKRTQESISTLSRIKPEHTGNILNTYDYQRRLLSLFQDKLAIATEALEDVAHSGWESECSHLDRCDCAANISRLALERITQIGEIK